MLTGVIIDYDGTDPDAYDRAQAWLERRKLLGYLHEMARLHRFRLFLLASKAVGGTKAELQAQNVAWRAWVVSEIGIEEGNGERGLSQSFYIGTVTTARTPGGWRVRLESLAILLSFVAAAVFMTWLYTQVGYVRPLGVAHLVFWSPVYVWVLLRRRALQSEGLFGKYVLRYLVVAGISLVIDLIDLIRYLLGDG